MKAKNRKIGQRRDASAIIRFASFVNFLLCVISALFFFILYFLLPGTSQMLGFAYGLLVSGILALAAWGSELVIAKFFNKVQGVVYPLNFALKIILFFGFFVIIRFFAEIDSRFFVLGFAIALVFSLIASSIIVMREDGPDFDFIER